MKQAPGTNEVTYSKEERDAALVKMKDVSSAFYYAATRTNCHPFIEFCGLMNEYIKVCEAASEAGVDFMMANVHTGQAIPMKDYEAAYIGEKFGCIFGPTFHDPELFKAFLSQLELPFDVQVIPEKA